MGELQCSSLVNLLVAQGKVTETQFACHFHSFSGLTYFIPISKPKQMFMI
jgi:hypothetical protein